MQGEAELTVEGTRIFHPPAFDQPARQPAGGADDVVFRRRLRIDDTHDWAWSVTFRRSRLLFSAISAFHFTKA